MNNISVHCAISVLRRLPLKMYKRIAILQTHRQGFSSKWQRAINHTPLFLHMFQFRDKQELTHDWKTELLVWKSAFPNYPKLMNWNDNFRIYKTYIKRELRIQRVLDDLCGFSNYYIGEPIISREEILDLTNFNNTSDKPSVTVVCIGNRPRTIILPAVYDFNYEIHIINHSTNTIVINPSKYKLNSNNDITFVNGVATDLIHPPPLVSDYADMRMLQNQMLGYYDVQDFLIRAININMDLPQLLQDLIDIRNWPTSTSIAHDDFWHGVFGKLAAYSKGCSLNDKAKCTAFLEKYLDKVDWKNDIYALIDADFLQKHKDLWESVTWRSIILSIRLPEYILQYLMENVTKYKVNFAQIPIYQFLSEQFIERWFVDTQYDQEQIWENIFNLQQLSIPFKIKYAHKRFQGVASQIKRYIKSPQ